MLLSGLSIAGNTARVESMEELFHPLDHEEEIFRTVS